MRCPVCCEPFFGERCPRCGMRVSSSTLERQAFAGEGADALSRPDRPTAPSRPGARRGKVSLIALERRQARRRFKQRAGARFWKRIACVFVLVFLVSLCFSALRARDAEPEPYSDSSPCAELEQTLADWAQEQDNGLVFFYTSEDGYMNAALSIPGMEDAADLADEDPDVWTGMLDICHQAYESTRARMDQAGAQDTPLMVLGLDEDSGELMLCLEGNSILYSAIQNE